MAGFSPGMFQEVSNPKPSGWIQRFLGLGFSGCRRADHGLPLIHKHVINPAKNHNPLPLIQKHVINRAKNHSPQTCLPTHENMALVLVRFSGSTAENFRARRLARSKVSKTVTLPPKGFSTSRTQVQASLLSLLLILLSLLLESSKVSKAFERWRTAEVWARCSSQRSF